MNRRYFKTNRDDEELLLFIYFWNLTTQEMIDYFFELKPYTWSAKLKKLYKKGYISKSTHPYKNCGVKVFTLTDEGRKYVENVFGCNKKYTFLGQNRYTTSGWQLDHNFWLIQILKIKYNIKTVKDFESLRYPFQKVKYYDDDYKLCVYTTKYARSYDIIYMPWCDKYQCWDNPIGIEVEKTIKSKERYFNYDTDYSDNYSKTILDSSCLFARIKSDILNGRIYGVHFYVLDSIHQAFSSYKNAFDQEEKRNSKIHCWENIEEYKTINPNNIKINIIDQIIPNFDPQLVRKTSYPEAIKRKKYKMMERYKESDIYDKIEDHSFYDYHDILDEKTKLVIFADCKEQATIWIANKCYAQDNHGYDSPVFSDGIIWRPELYKFAAVYTDFNKFKELYKISKDKYIFANIKFNRYYEKQLGLKIDPYIINPKLIDKDLEGYCPELSLRYRT